MSKRKYVYSPTQSRRVNKKGTPTKLYTYKSEANITETRKCQYFDPVKLNCKNRYCCYWHKLCPGCKNCSNYYPIK